MIYSCPGEHIALLGHLSRWRWHHLPCRSVLAQAKRMAWISSGVGSPAGSARYCAAMSTRRSLLIMTW